MAEAYTLKLNRKADRDAIGRQLQAAAIKRLRAVGKDFKNEIKVESEGKINKWGTRDELRRNPDTTRGKPHYVNSFRYEVRKRKDGGTLYIYSDSDPMVVRIIEYGSKEHTIMPRLRQSRRRKTNKAGRGGGFTGAYLQWPKNNYAKHAPPWVLAKKVKHPGTGDGQHIMRDALGKAIDRHLR